jgi:hypothetical protein
MLTLMRHGGEAGRIGARARPTGHRPGAAGDFVGFESWHAFYRSDLQSVTLLLIAPALLLGTLLTRGRRRAATTPAARFVYGYALVFSVGTLVDPIATGPLVRALALPESAATALGLLFVLLGDFRVFLLVFHLADGARDLRAALRRAALWTPVVPVSAFAISAALRSALGELPDQVLWLVHEVLFVGMALWLRKLAAHDVRLRRAATYVAVYYVLWAAADVTILFGHDVGWLLRVLPNQLYYAFWVPFVYVTWRARGDGAS